MDALLKDRHQPFCFIGHGLPLLRRWSLVNEPSHGSLAPFSPPGEGGPAVLAHALYDGADALALAPKVKDAGDDLVSCRAAGRAHIFSLAARVDLS